jgi:hypothetical protein
MRAVVIEIVDAHLHGGPTDFHDIIKPTVVDNIAVIIDLNPATAAHTRIYSRRDVNHVCVFLRRRRFSGQIEVELSGFAQLRLGIEDRCFDLSIDNESDLISGNSQAIADVMAVGIGLNNLGKILRFNPDIGAFYRSAGGVFHEPFENRGASVAAERYKQ